MPEFRWILLGCGIVLLVGIWWWGARRSRQAPGDAQLRESTAAPAAVAPLHPAGTHTEAPATATSDWGVPPFEPLSIHTADFDNVPHIDLSMTAHSEPFDDTLDLSNVEETGAPAEPRIAPQRAVPLPAVPLQATPQSPSPVPPRLASMRTPPAAAITAPVSTAPVSTAPAVTASAVTASAVRASVAKTPAAKTPAATVTQHLESSDRFSSVEAEEPNVSEKQRIVSLRVCARGDELWQGADLLAVLEGLGLAHGRYHVFHRKHSDGRTLFCAASLVEPGTFDLARMTEEAFRGLTLFAVLPGPAEPLQTIDALLSTAMDIADALQGSVQITKGEPLSDEGVATLRQDVARFQASMTG